MVRGVGVRGSFSAARPAARPRAQGRRPALGAVLGAAVLATAGGGCRRTSEPGPGTIRLVEKFDPKKVEGSPSAKAQSIPRTEWRFDGAAPVARGATAAPAAPPGKPAPFAATRGWEAGPGISGLAIRDGLLVGHAKDDHAVLHVERISGLENPDQLQAIEIRMRVSAGANLHIVTRPTPTVDLPAEEALSRVLPGAITTPVIAGPDMQTYTVTPPAPVTGARIRHLLIRPTDAAGADFAIESVRLVFRREHLASVPSGLSWQGLRDVFHETLVTRTPERIRWVPWGEPREPAPHAPILRSKAWVRSATGTYCRKSVWACPAVISSARRMLNELNEVMNESNG